MRTEVPAPSARRSRPSSSSRRGLYGLVALLAISCGAQSIPAEPSFSGAEALRTIEKQVAFGPRIPGTAGHEATLKWLVAELKESGAQVAKRPFQMTNALTGEEVTGTNVMARFGGSTRERIFFAAHWDTRVHADQDPDSTKRRDPVPGANDGGSGVAILLQLARLLSENPPPMGVDLLFFDGEDQGTYSDPRTFSLGARAFVASAPLTGFRPQYGILVDLAGGRGVRFATDFRSWQDARPLMESVNAVLGKYLPDRMALDRVMQTEDDHVPFLDAGIPCVVIFGSGDPNWHTTNDLPESCSPEVLEGVGNTLLEFIYEADKQP